MNEFERLLAYLKVAYHNMTTLHRHLTRDAGWFGNHEQLGEWYGVIADQLDDLVEVGLALGYTEPTITEAVLALPDVMQTTDIGLAEALTGAAGIMQNIITMMQSAEDIVPPAVANKLQEYEYYWLKTANYKIAHALGTDGVAIEEDDDE